MNVEVNTDLGWEPFGSRPTLAHSDRTYVNEQIRRWSKQKKYLLGNNMTSFYNPVFPKVDHSGNATRIVLEQKKFSKKSYL